MPARVLPYFPVSYSTYELTGLATSPRTNYRGSYDPSGGGGGGNFRPGGKHHTAQSGSESSAQCTWYVLIIVHVYKHWEGSTRFRGGGDYLSGYWPLQRRHLYLKGVLIYRGVLTYGEIRY